MPIRILDPTAAAQIAAGEVVERPASVIKELIENAIDSDARRINVEARGGGVRELKVQDDGCGIPADEVELAFGRHATSKIQHANDLWSIQTLGFRGEALPSIASVAQVVCITRTADEEVGTELRIAGSDVQARMPKGCSQGTSMSVRNLFYNTPVRRDYLRSDATEMSAISMIVQQYALAYPEISFTLLLDGRLALQTGGTGNIRDVIIEIYGLDVARQLLPVDTSYGENEELVTIYGMLSPPGLTRSSRSYIHIFVNRRAIQPRGQLVYVIEEAYHTLLMKGRHPLAVLDIRVHPGTVDVNVHPTKSEVRFRHNARITSILGRTVREALLEGADVQSWTQGTDSTAPSTENAPRRFEVRQMAPGDSSASSTTQQPSAAWRVARPSWDTRYSRWDVGADISPLTSEQQTEQYAEQEPAATTSQSPDSSEFYAAQQDDTPLSDRPPVSPVSSKTRLLDDDSGDTQSKPDNVADDTAMSDVDTDTAPATDSSTFADSSQPLPRLPPLRVVGQVGMTYIIAESPHGMYMIDQHATHERISYERLMAQRGQGPIESQELLMPQTIELSPAAVQMLTGATHELHEWGFALDEWGEGLIRVRAVPALLPLENLQSALLEIVDHLSGQGGSTPHDWREAMLITLSCHTSVRAGQVLALDEMRELLRQLERCHNPHTCPHGRPTMVLMTPDQLERQFGRKV